MLWIDHGPEPRLTLFDKNSLGVAKTLALPGPALTAAAYSATGCHVLVGVGGASPLLLALDSVSGREIARLLLRGPRGIHTPAPSASPKPC